ncbi:torsin-1A-interacting protein 2-like [Acanthaster planci]|uniref:Torsin-1A-interacting protein 2-like n=1 Tax=Acanthaster planci TaxID=133434 RepID=A0A8B7XWR6_ACAPL|nr:torsin-1A-interacting protein 2-like [Acanthaster planci]
MPSTTRSQSKKRGMEPSKISAETKNLKGKFKTNDGKKQELPVDETGRKSANQEDGHDEPDRKASHLTDQEQRDASCDQDQTPQKPADQNQGNENNKFSTRMPAESGKYYKVAQIYKQVREIINRRAKNLLLVSVLVLIAAVLVYPYKMYMPGDKPASVRQLEYTQRMQNLKSLFPTQGEHFWDIVEATVNGHLAQGSDPVVPIVLLFGSRPAAADSTKCLTEKLGTLLSETLLAKNTSMALINGKDYRNMDSDVAKEGIDQCLQAAFEGGQKAAVVLSLDALPPCSILLFHSYCENEDARYKDAALIFTVTLKEGHPPSRELIRSKPLNLMGKEAFEISDHLTQVWTDKCHMLPQGKVEAMLSRVANNVATVQKENVVPC